MWTKMKMAGPYAFLLLQSTFLIREKLETNEGMSFHCGVGGPQWTRFHRLFWLYKYPHSPSSFIAITHSHSSNIKHHHRFSLLFLATRTQLVISNQASLLVTCCFAWGKYSIHFSSFLPPQFHLLLYFSNITCMFFSLLCNFKFCYIHINTVQL